MSILEIRGISKSFGAYTALRKVSLEVEAGEFVSLLGPSGCGKTTLLRLVAGFLRPDTGAVLIEGRDMTALPPNKRPLNTVFQNYALFPHMTFAQNVAYGPLRAGASRTEARERAAEALDMVGLGGHGQHYPREASGGQQQRAALARAIVNRPKLLLLDEPLSALDLQLRRRMQIELKRLQERIGIAFIFVTHDQEEAMAMSDRIVVMNAGRIEQVGCGGEIYRAPQTRFVAQFIGDANLFAAGPAGNWEMQPVPAVEACDAARIAVVRPEHVSLIDAAACPEDALVFEGTVEAVAGISGMTHLHVGVGEGTVTVRILGMDTSVSEGQPVRLSVPRQSVHFIDNR
ncbi:ABC transporter ATP-binding protein [Shinella daejeonensis]|uniref:ABC transporter ATP-binding protein n=1 Tax=Shinella daejeonensis TaxID=659017 RepID=UPI0020C80AE1|nr:ABC transporter ATP-binding protein [Shinella daejeonensis]MCP8895055.1 ABC transporter ATP-binding protein [Shinella daejeonensis]